ncbi:hypothetical protein D6853_09615 [Butyrivibrio sp. X503]|uniref:rod shape-determining protein n=1 Tax=Butyrivibrio sp. X503 TaxID=2364878 RepID=UPI000EA9CC4A|nr:rod shape-determining protein [Butyrivibrio sp. X503]RKM55793.1 hypothetical protein D6853_09615 [Butyrivibrio sp. X503]
MNIIDSAADIKIYNYKTKEMHCEKALVWIRNDTETLTCLGDECVDAYKTLPESDKQNMTLIAPIALGKIVDYANAERLIRYMVKKYIDGAGGKRRIFRRSSRALLVLHEPCSEIEQKAYEDLVYKIGYKGGVSVINSETKLYDITHEEAIIHAEETSGKLDCAIEITKNEPKKYAECAFEIFKSNCKRWGVDPENLYGNI